MAVGEVGAGERARGKWTARPRIDRDDRRRRVGIDDRRADPRLTGEQAFDAAKPGDDPSAGNAPFVAPFRPSPCRALRRGVGGAASKPIAITLMTSTRTIRRGSSVGESAGAVRARAIDAGRARPLALARVERARG